MITLKHLLIEKICSLIEKNLKENKHCCCFSQASRSCHVNLSPQQKFYMLPWYFTVSSFETSWLLNICELSPKPVIAIKMRDRCCQSAQNKPAHKSAPELVSQVTCWFAIRCLEKAKFVFHFKIYWIQFERLFIGTRQCWIGDDISGPIATG